MPPADYASAAGQRAGFPVRMIRVDPDVAAGVVGDTVAVNPNR